MKTTDIILRRSRWLKLAKSLTLLTIKRNSLIHQACPDGFLEGDDQRKNKDAIDKTAKAIHQTLTTMANVEEGEPNIGAYAVLDAPVPLPIHHALVLMATSRLSGDTDREFRDVSDFMDAVSARNPDTAIEVRSAFRHDGQLGPLVTMRVRDESIDTYRPTLREEILNQMLAIKPDIEFTVMRGRR
ncbi:MAG: hypothetical protein K9N51_13425 [Candidatus Pacebacteria bacterium]|nr:hypothetical protein [Candidatus Paceibacterota bacterium]